MHFSPSPEISQLQERQMMKHTTDDYGCAMKRYFDEFNLKPKCELIQPQWIPYIRNCAEFEHSNNIKAMTSTDGYCCWDWNWRKEYIGIFHTAQHSTDSSASEFAFSGLAGPSFGKNRMLFIFQPFSRNIWKWFEIWVKIWNKCLMNTKI